MTLLTLCPDSVPARAPPLRITECRLLNIFHGVLNHQLLPFFLSFFFKCAIVLLFFFDSTCIKALLRSLSIT